MAGHVEKLIVIIKVPQTILLFLVGQDGGRGIIRFVSWNTFLRREKLVGPTYQPPLASCFFFGGGGVRTR